MRKNSFIKTLIVFVLLILNTNIAISKTIHFAVTSDVNYSATPNPKADKANVALDGFIDRVNENKYDFVVFLGDNLYKSKRNNLDGFLATIKRIKKPYYLVIGNQDAHKISGIDKKEYVQIVSKQNKYQKKKDKSYYFYPSSDLIVIVLDNVSSGMPSNHGVFSKKNLAWLDNVLTKNEKKHAVIFQHVPYISTEKKELELLDKTNFKAALAKHDNIIAIFAGHYQYFAIENDNAGITHICTPALYIEPYEYLDIKIKYNKKPLSKAKNFVIDTQAKPAI